MLNFLTNFNKSGKIYSFAKIVSIGNFEVTVAYKNSSKIIKTEQIYNKKDWVIFYGYLEENTIYPEYIEKISGIDVNILERFINFLSIN